MIPVMEAFIIEIGLAVTLFVGTNIDDVFVLLAFFSDSRFKEKQVVMGQYLGSLALSLGSIVLSFGAKQIPQAYIGLLGIIPFALGAKKLWELFRASEDEESDEDIEGLSVLTSAKIFTVAGVTMANGGDNVGVYVPLFATKPFGILLLYTAVFMIMTAVWCAMALYLVNHRHVGAVIKRFSHYIVPWVFMALGLYILYEAKTLTLFVL